jgi:AcrR family transcriptional regulator
METGCSLLDRKKARVRQTFIEVATRLFLERGFDNVSVDEITEVAEISRSTFFRYFLTKEALVFRNHSERLQRFRDALTGAPAELGPLEAIAHAFVDLSLYYQSRRDELLDEYRIVTTSTYLVTRDIELDFGFERAIAAEIERRMAGAPDARMRSRIFGGALFGVARACLEDWFEGGCREDLAQMGTDALNVFNEGLYAKPATQGT